MLRKLVYVVYRVIYHICMGFVLFFYIAEFDMIAVCSLLDWINVHESPSPPL